MSLIIFAQGSYQGPFNYILDALPFELNGWTPFKDHYIAGQSEKSLSASLPIYT